ncbi:MAG: hypothetical protein JWM91_1963, partial [Rhodospirillales bacterium]|nr:hypothetical protein [Rhodospirillales bacterium]
AENLTIIRATSYCEFGGSVGEVNPIVGYKQPPP